MAGSLQQFPPALLLLTPRLTLTGDPSGSIEGINTTTVGTGALVYCRQNASTYRLDREDNSTPPDGTLVIEPTAGPGRWKLFALGDHKVLVDGTDTTAGFLAAKLVAGAGVTLAVLNAPGDEQLQVTAAGDHQVMVDAFDTTSGFLTAKVAPGPGIIIDVIGAPGSEQLRITASQSPEAQPNASEVVDLTSGNYTFVDPVIGIYVGNGGDIFLKLRLDPVGRLWENVPVGVLYGDFVLVGDAAAGTTASAMLGLQRL